MRDAEVNSVNCVKHPFGDLEVFLKAARLEQRDGIVIDSLHLSILLPAFAVREEMAADPVAALR